MSKETDGLDELLCWNVKRAEVAEEQVTQLKQENQQLKEQLKNDALKMLNSMNRYDTGELLRENIRLNSSQENTAIEYLNKVKAMFKETDYNVDWIFNRIDNMIKELKNK